MDTPNQEEKTQIFKEHINRIIGQIVDEKVNVIDNSVTEKF